MRSAAKRGALVACALVAAAWLAVEIFLPRRSVTLPPPQIQHVEGCAYQTAAPASRRRWLETIAADGLNAPGASDLVLTENGHPLGPAHTLHAQIARGVAGGYSHWAASIYFSAPDCSDPRSNGRIYVASAIRHPTPPVRITGVLALFGALALGLPRRAPHERAQSMPLHLARAARLTAWTVFLFAMANYSRLS